MNRKTLGKLLFLPFIASAMLLTSCEDDQGVIVNIPLGYTDIYLEVNPAPAGVSGNLDSILVDNSDLDSILAANNATQADIKSIKLTSLKFTIVDSANHQIISSANFNALNASSVSINTASLAEVVVASKNPIPQNTNPLNLDVNSTQDLAPYIKSSQFFIKAQGSTNAAITQKMFVKVNILFDVEAEI